MTKSLRSELWLELRTRRKKLQKPAKRKKFRLRLPLARKRIRPTSPERHLPEFILRRRCWENGTKPNPLSSRWRIWSLEKAEILTTTLHRLKEWEEVPRRSWISVSTKWAAIFGKDPQTSLPVNLCQPLLQKGKSQKSRFAEALMSTWTPEGRSAEWRTARNRRSRSKTTDTFTSRSS